MRNWNRNGNWRAFNKIAFFVVIFFSIFPIFLFRLKSKICCCISEVQIFAALFSIQSEILSQSNVRQWANNHTQNYEFYLHLLRTHSPISSDKTAKKTSKTKLFRIFSSGEMKFPKNNL